MPLPITKGAASSQGFGEFAKTGGPALYIEDVFSTYLYTGNGGGSNNTIVNGVDISTNGGLTWIKNRSSAIDHFLFDTARGMGFAIQPPFLITNTTDSQQTSLTDYIRANTTGFTLGSNATGSGVNASGSNYASWTFRKAAKFFDVVTYTGTGSARTIAHNLGSTPGCIIVKRTDTTGDWQVYHNSLTSAAYSIQLNLTNAQASATTVWNSTAPTSSVFSVGTDATVNASGGTYVAYVFAHNAGGFGLTGTDNVISCGSFPANNGQTINLGFEPQWLLYKDTASVNNWRIADNMRGLTNLAGVNANTIKQLMPNLANAESDNSGPVLTSTGFTWNQNGGGNTYIYIAIRRGPMKVPTDGTTVFSPVAYSGTGTSRTISGTNNPVDLAITTIRDSSGSGGDKLWNDRLRGAYQTLYSNYTSSESTQSNYITGLDVEFGIKVGTALPVNGSGVSYITELFSRAPSFFDVVCYTGTGANLTVAHNLGAVPEMIIIKCRSRAGYDWNVGFNFQAGSYDFLSLNQDYPSTNNPYSGHYSSQPTNSSFFLATNYTVNEPSSTYVAYLFATCAGVSKVGSYTGNGSTQTINCGFTGGARFVLIKRTDNIGNWYVYDTARGMTTLTDPYLFLNSTAAETATLGSVTTVTTGFAVNAAVLAAINTNAATYIYLAIA